MIRVFIFLVVLSTISCTASKKTVEEKVIQTPTKQIVGVPAIRFDDAYHNFGDVIQGETREKIYSFANTGNADLLIELVTACTCTDVDWPRHALKPGERGAIRVIFNSAGKEGETKVDVDVISNTDPIVATAVFRANVVVPE